MAKRKNYIEDDPVSDSTDDAVTVEKIEPPKDKTAPKYEIRCSKEKGEMKMSGGFVVKPEWGDVPWDYPMGDLMWLVRHGCEMREK